MSAGKEKVRIGIDFGRCLTDNVTSVEHFTAHGCDFMVTKLFNNEAVSRLAEATETDRYLGETDCCDMLNSLSWSNLVVSRLTLDKHLEHGTVDEINNAEDALQEQLDWTYFLGLPATMMELAGDNTNCARIIMRNIMKPQRDCTVWCSIPALWKSEDINETEKNMALKSWRVWDDFRMACNQNHRAAIALRVSEDLPMEYAKDFDRWMGEPVKAIIIPKKLFRLNKKGFPVLLKTHQEFILKFAHLDPYLIIEAEEENEDLHYYVAYLTTGLWNKRKEVDSIEQYAFGFEDTLQAPLQPLMDNLESSTYEVFEKDPVKYKQYFEAVKLALLDKDLPIIRVYMLGAGRGPIVSEILKAADDTKKKIELFAIEKNKFAVYILKKRNSQEWNNRVTIISSDMRKWNPTEKADIIVSELLGSFGDNELSPECLMGASDLLKEDAISIPEWYTSYLSPISSETLYNAVRKTQRRDRPGEFAFQMPYVVRLHNKYILADPISVFSFSHPGAKMKGNNSHRQYERLKWTLTNEARVHGFAGYFHCCLYKDVFMSIHPHMHTEKMFSWYPVFFPLESSVLIGEGETLEIGMWRCARESDAKRWYEWRVIKPTPGLLHNPDGQSSTIGCNS